MYFILQLIAYSVEAALWSFRSGCCIDRTVLVGWSSCRRGDDAEVL